MALARWRAFLITDPLIVVSTIVLGSISLACSLVDRSGRAQHRVARLWSRMLLGVSGVRVRVSGLEKLDRKASYVLVSNHQSLMDTPVVMGHIPLEFRFFAKKGLFRIPFLGWHLRRAGHLPVVRTDARARLKSLNEAARLMEERRISLLLFPEGGRSPDGLREFREGAAYLAIKAGVPAVPIGIIGTRAVLSMGSAVVTPGCVELRVGDPIPTSAMISHDRAHLNQVLREKVAELIGSPAPPPTAASAASHPSPPGRYGLPPGREEG